jgi:hypothetical protein
MNVQADTTIFRNALLCMEVKDFAGAHRQLKRASPDAWGSQRAYELLYLINARVKDWPDALCSAHDLSPNSPSHYLAIAWALWNLGRRWTALQAALRAHLLFPQNALAAKDIAFYLKAQGSPAWESWAEMGRTLPDRTGEISAAWESDLTNQKQQNT